MQTKDSNQMRIRSVSHVRNHNGIVRWADVWVTLDAVSSMDVAGDDVADGAVGVDDVADDAAGVDDVAGDVTDAAYAAVDVAFVVVVDDGNVVAVVTDDVGADVDVVVIDVVPSVDVEGAVERLSLAAVMRRRQQ